VIVPSAHLLLDAVELHEAHLFHRKKPLGKITQSMDDYIARWLVHRFDEHRQIDLRRYRNRPSGEAEASLSQLVAADLEMDGDIRLERILRYSHKFRLADDGNYVTDFRLSTLVKLTQLHFFYGPNRDFYETELEKAVWIYLDGMFAKEEAFHSCEPDFLHRSTRIHTIWAGKRPIRVGVIVSEIPEIQKYARREGIDVVVVRKKTGHTQIFRKDRTDKEVGLDLGLVVASLRDAERKKKGITVPFQGDLGAPGGFIPGAEEWYFAKHASGGQQILNGSETHYRPPTALPLDDIGAITVNVLQADLITRHGQPRPPKPQKPKLIRKGHKGKGRSKHRREGLQKGKPPVRGPKPAPKVAKAPVAKPKKAKPPAPKKSTSPKPPPPAKPKAEAENVKSEHRSKGNRSDDANKPIVTKVSRKKRPKDNPAKAPSAKHGKSKRPTPPEE
jgi:hypothetical protein